MKITTQLHRTHTLGPAVNTILATIVNLWIMNFLRAEHCHRGQEKQKKTFFLSLQLKFSRKLFEFQMTTQLCKEKNIKPCIKELNKYQLSSTLGHYPISSSNT